MKHSMTKKIFSLAVSGLWLALTCSHVAFGAQEPKAKNDTALTQTAVTAQESNIKDPDAALTATAFTYQGQLKDANGPVNGSFDFQFTLYSAQTGGEPLGVSEMEDVVLTNGMFSFKLDFGRVVFETKESWLEIGVRPSGSAEDYTVLFPRQKLTPTPYAIFAQHEQWSLIGVPVGFADRAVIQAGADAVPEPDGAMNLKDDESPKTEAQAAAAPQGTPNFIAKFDGNGLPTANSIMVDDGATVTINNGRGPTNPLPALDIASGRLSLSSPYGDIQFTETVDLFANITTPNPNGTDTAFRVATGTGLKVLATLLNNGNMGLGTQNPTSKVEIAAQDGLAISGFQPFLTLRDTNSGGLRSFIQGVNGDLVFIPQSFQNRGAAMVIKNVSGNVGIGTSIPTSKVEIAAQDGLAISGFQPFLTLRDTSSGGLRSFIQGVNGDLVFIPQSFQNRGAAMVIRTGSGNVEVFGQTTTRVLQITGGGDLSEKFDVRTLDEADSPTAPPVEPGMVVSIDPEHSGQLIVSSQAYDRRVAGIISGAGGIKPGMLMGQAGSVVDGEHPVALSGRVYCWTDASYGAIEPGDMLTTSDTPGHAMKVKNHKKANGAILGKAMTKLEQGKGLVLVLVTLQ